MTEDDALASFSALSEPTRLRIVRLLVEAWPEGLPAGVIGAAMDGASSSRMSFHLARLDRAGLVAARRDGRTIRYSAVYPALTGLADFLLRDCCRRSGGAEAAATAIPVPHGEDDDGR